MRPKIGLVLGGGGSRGIAHIGVLEVLVRESIPIDLIVGTSMGGIVGALFAEGLAPQALAQGFEQLQGNNLFSMSLFSARARQRTVERWLEPVLDRKTFADLQIPLAVMAVDLRAGREVCLEQGPLIPALLATSAMPAIFPPVEHQDMILADGGVIDSLATHTAFERGAERVIAVDIYPALEHDELWSHPAAAIMGLRLPFSRANRPANRTPSMLESIWRSTRVMTWHLHQERLAASAPDVLLRPEVGHYGSMDFKDISGPLEAGRAEAERHLPQIRALLRGDEAEAER
jgi:NTE family protein